MERGHERKRERRVDREKEMERGRRALVMKESRRVDLYQLRHLFMTVGASHFKYHSSISLSLSLTHTHTHTHRDTCTT